MVEEWRRGEYVISTDKRRLDIRKVHEFLSTAYWSQNVPLATVERAIENSMVFGLYHGMQQAGMARIITDRATFAYVSDVFILEPHRGQGLGQWLMRVVRDHPELQRLRRWMLATRDAHGLYQKSGFTPLNAPERFMEVWDPEIYTRTREP
jgi:GNAT superfamily N-acetyltransferase